MADETLSPPLEAASRPNRFPRIIGLGCLGIAVLVLTGLLASSIWVHGYVRGESFRKMIGQKTGSFLGVDGEYMPLQWDGFTVYSDGFEARGRAGSPIARLRADEVRAELHPRGLLHHAWQVDNLEIQRLRVVLGSVLTTDASAAASRPATGPAKPGPGWLPRNLDLRNTSIHETDLIWDESGRAAGSIQKVRLGIEPDGAAWIVTGTGGKLRQTGWPDAAVDRLKLRYRRGQLSIVESVLRPDETGTIGVSGEIDFDPPSRLDLSTQCNNVSVTPLLPEDWRARLHGNLTGNAQVRGSPGDPDSIKAVGSVRLVSGRLEALPVLEQIALFTHTDQFRQLPLQTASADFAWDKSGLTVTRLVLESEGLIRVEGNFKVTGRVLDGRFQVGVTPSSLRWLPGSRARVFTVDRSGYLWTSMRVTGPIDHLEEDLSPRLASAAGAELIDDAAKAARQGANGVIDLLAPLIP